MAKQPLYYTFGNHMHWVDMEWLWGYHVLPGSIRDMLHLCREAGVKGCVNFDGIGYEKLASEAPEALADLREAIEAGVIEPVGCSYGQPYGLFHGGESNVRQLIFGARAVKRLLGIWPKTFWEEEFYFFPHLPQMLRGCGFEFASLFFQWTWHTPEVPVEDVPVVWWEGQDGCRLLCATRNNLNLHQWPEDMEASLSEFGETHGRDAHGNHGRDVRATEPLILQWLELMPSSDWMCRSELILPKLKELMAGERFDVRPCTLREYLRQSSASPTSPTSSLPVRRYTMDDVWHGLTLGKNGDNMRRLSREAEATLLSAETLAAVAGLFGRPYAQWDVYPTWELEEAWRELLSVQHHDNDECEGLCGHVGRLSYERSKRLAAHVEWRTLKCVASAGGDGSVHRAPFVSIEGGVERQSRQLVFNPLGWERAVTLGHDDGPPLLVPGLGFIRADRRPMGPLVSAVLERDSLRVDIEDDSASIRQIVSTTFASGALRGHGAFRLQCFRGGHRVEIPALKRDQDRLGDEVYVAACLNPIEDAIAVKVHGHLDKRPDPGLNAALQTQFHLAFRPRIIADHPYGVSEILPIEKALRKYPKGDWMTSEQWFEEVRRPFTALSFVDLLDADNPERGLLIVHDGSQQWFLDEEENAVRCVLNAYDPWDEDYFQGSVRANFLLVPHGPMKNSERWKIAQEFLRPVHRAFFAEANTGETRVETVGGTPMPQEYSALSVEPSNVIATAFYRETRDSARGQESHAADTLGVDYPYVVRLVEFDGEECEVVLTFGATVAKAFKTNLLGEIEEELIPENVILRQEESQQQTGKKSQTSGRAPQRNLLRIAIRPFEIATIYLDLIEGRKQQRGLDAKREVWATVHRNPGEKPPTPTSRNA